MAANGKRNGGPKGRGTGANGAAKGNGKPPSDRPPEPETSAKEPEEAKVAARASEPSEGPGGDDPAIEPVIPPEAPHRGAAWGEPIARFEAHWTKLESRLLTFVLVWQILALVSWVFLNGLSESVTTTAGAVFRAVLIASALGVGGWYATRKQGEERQRAVVILATCAGIGLVIAWRRLAIAGQPSSSGSGYAFDKASVDYFDNIKGWLQEGSILTLLGGLRGLGTRLTLWLALLGGSLATAAGKHIHIDVVFRFIPKKLRNGVAILNYCAAAAVCSAGVWGFFDHVAIESYGSRADDPAKMKIANAMHHIGHHAFFTRKQLGLDARSLPHVLKGERYDRWMTAAAWNEWLDGAGFEDRFEPEKVKALRIPPEAGTHPPFVVSPDGETTRGALAHTLGLVFPFGLLAIALRFLLRALLTLSGHISADPDEAHKEDLRGAAEGGA